MTPTGTPIPTPTFSVVLKFEGAGMEVEAARLLLVERVAESLIMKLEDVGKTVVAEPGITSERSTRGGVPVGELDTKTKVTGV